MTKPLTIWQETAYKIAKSILRRDDRTIKIYFVRTIRGIKASENLYWHPDYQEPDPYEEDVPYREKTKYISFEYEDDRTLQLLLQVGFLDKDKTESFPLDNETARIMGYKDEDNDPAGYCSYPNWAIIKDNDFNMEGIYAQPIKLEVISNIELPIDRNDLSLISKYGTYELKYKNILIHTFQKKNLVYLCFSYFFKGKNFEEYSRYDKLISKLRQKRFILSDMNTANAEAKILKVMGRLIDQLNKNKNTKKLNLLFHYDQNAHGICISVTNVCVKCD